MKRELLLLLVAIALFAFASPAVRWLVREGGDAISFCNVLFVGNFCAGCLTLALARPRRVVADLRAVSTRGWWLLAANVALAIAIPVLIFTALQTTTVTSAVLLGRLEAVSFALLSTLFFRSRVRRAEWVGYAIIVAGVVGIVLVQGMGTLPRGDWLVIIASGLFGLAACASKLALEHTPLATFVFVRNFASALVFFVVAIVLFGFGHFAHAFGPGLWAVMVVYALALVVIAQLAWYRALATLPAATVANWAMMTPILAIMFASLLLGEVPTAAQWGGGVIIVIGMVVSAGERGPEAGMEKSLAAA